MKKRWITLLVLCAFAIISITNYDRIVFAMTKNNAYWYQDNTHLVIDETLGDGIYRIEKEEDMSIYTKGYQNAVSQDIETTLQQSSSPLLIYNPFGTNSSSFYYTFESDTPYTISYRIHVEDESIADYEQVAKLHKLEDGSYAYQFIGFVHGMQNELSITYQQDDKVIKTETHTIQMPESKNAANQKLTVSEGTSTQAISDGLFAVFGLDKNYQSNVYLYDNDGIMRSEYILKNYRSDRLLWIDDCLLYAYKKNGFIKVDSLGKIVGIYNFEGYEQHHDFIYDEKSDSLLILADETETDTIEDVVISYNLKTNEVKKIIDMKELLPSLYEQAIYPEEGNTYGGDELDWIHLNSLTLDGTSLLVSSRELSSIIKINDIYSDPTIEYMIADPSVYQNDQATQAILLEKDGDFISQSGQHSITFSSDATLRDGQYYITMYNNNYTAARTRDDIDWSAFVGAGSFNEGEASYYYKYLVDETKGTYTLVDHFALPYSSIVSNIQDYENTIVTSSGKSHCFNEYDTSGKMIRQYNYEAEKYAYRVFKYNFNQFYFS